MRKQILIAAVLITSTATAQEGVHYFNSADYSKLKTAGELPSGKIIELMEPLRDSTPVLSPATRSSGCGCYVDPDPSYILAMAPNDDGSSSLINLPFNFCLYGTNYSSLYINNNGNVSFGTPYSTFSAAGFPSASYVMVAPFWGDVDTRGIGQVVYKIYPNAIYINWVDVGYFSYYTDKINTFQLILSDGTDTTAGIGNNVAFCYKDMQWTTGDASSGVGGFGGVPATVGANKGNGIDYIQFGRFDQPGTAYDGPVGMSDGVSWLDYQSFKFSTCVTTANVQPVFVDFSPAMANTAYDCGTTAGDTVKICATGDTLIFSATVLDPNISDIVNLSVTSSSAVGFTVLDTIVGNPSTITWQFVADPANYGFNSFTVLATDNGTPMLSATAGFLVFVDTTGIGSFDTNISGDTLLCPGETTVLSVPNLFDSYDWSTGSSVNTSGTISSGGDYFVTLTKNGCYKSFEQTVYELPEPTPPIEGILSLCASPTTTLHTDNIYTSYNWNFNGSNISSVDSATVSTPGTMILTVTDANGCTGDSTVSVVAGPTVNITGPLSACSGGSINLLATPNTTGTFSWSNGDGDSLTTVTTSGTYIVSFTDLAGCTVTDSQTVSFTITPDIIITTGDSVVCTGQSITLTVSGTLGGGSILWSTGQTSPSITVSSGTTVSVTVNNSGCTDSDAIPISFLPNPVVNIAGPTAWCSNETNSITASSASAGIFTWSSGVSSTGVASSTISPDATGTYSVVFTDNNGCTGTDSYAVTVYPTPVASFTADPAHPNIPLSLPTNVTYTNTSTIASPGVIGGYTWFINDTLQGTSTDLTHTYASFGMNEVVLVVISEDGCVDTTSTLYEVAPVLQMPNIFTPNGSGPNNFLTIKNLLYYAPVKLNIYNRWGTPVLETDNYNNNWDGKKNGNDVTEGVYYYEAVINTGKIYTGYIHISR